MAAVGIGIGFIIGIMAIWAFITALFGLGLLIVISLIGNAITPTYAEFTGIYTLNDTWVFFWNGIGFLVTFAMGLFITVPLRAYTESKKRRKENLGEVLGRRYP